MPSDYVPNLVSTIIPVFNRPEMLRRSVESVLSQTHRPIQIIIVDDGSTDATPQVGAELQSEYRDIIKFVRQENSGPGPARETGRKLADGEFIQYLDSDDLLRPNKFSDQVSALRKHADCDIAYGITQLVNSELELLASPFKWTGKKIDTIYPSLLVDRWWCTHTPLYRRSLTDRIGPWCSMRWSQDWEYDARAGRLNARLVTTDTIVSQHVHHDGVRQTSQACWRTDPVRLANRVDLLTRLWTNMLQSEAPRNNKECYHFSRWAFTIARRCAAQGMRQEMLRCFQLAHESAGNSTSARKGVTVFKILLGILGPKLAGRFSNWLENSRMKSTSENTLVLSHKIDSQQ